LGLVTSLLGHANVNIQQRETAELGGRKEKKDVKIPKRMRNIPGYVK